MQASSFTSRLNVKVPKSKPWLDDAGPNDLYIHFHRAHPPDPFPRSAPECPGSGRRDAEPPPSFRSIHEVSDALESRCCVTSRLLAVFSHASLLFTTRQSCKAVSGRVICHNKEEHHLHAPLYIYIWYVEETIHACMCVYIYIHVCVCM